MKTKSELLYSNLRDQLEKLSDSNSFDEYYENLSSNELREKLLSFIEIFTKEKNLIFEHFNGNTIYDGYDYLLNQIEDFKNHFENYPNLNYQELILLIVISKRIVLSVTELDNIQIDDEIYDCVLFPDSYLEIDYYFYLGLDSKKTIFLMNLSNPLLIQDVIEEMPLEFLFQLLGLLCGQEPKQLKKQLVIDKYNATHLKDITSILFAQMISDGKVLFKTPEYAKLPVNNYRDKFEVGNNYQQFSDLITILSEYNNQKDIFDKYLRLYQIIENFMYRFPIVSLENIQLGHIFGIRDFKVLYQKISKNEEDTLCTFIKEVNNNSRFNGISCKKYLHALWHSLIMKPSFNKIEINQFLKKLSLNNIDFDSINQDKLIIIYPNLIYKTRNSIVHNKETEFHLTYRTLTKSAQILIESFLIPSIEEIVFNLISSKNDLIWYKSSRLNLYEE